MDGGRWLKLHEQRYQWVRVAQGQQPSSSAMVVRSQSVETATMISVEVRYDAGKKVPGRKRHLSVDLLGLVLHVLMTLASLAERTGAKLVLKVHNCPNQQRAITQGLDGRRIPGRRVWALGNR